MLYKIQYVTYCLWVCEQALQYITTYVTHARTHRDAKETLTQCTSKQPQILQRFKTTV